VRIIVAGSRDWSDPGVVAQALELCAHAARDRGERLTVMHGHTKADRVTGYGAEGYADVWTMQAAQTPGSGVDWPIRFPAQWMGPCRRMCNNGHRRPDPGGWDTCPSAAYYRTDDMIARGADLLLAFIARDDRGPLYCIRLAVAKGIDHQTFRAAGG
jgi:hypothetical protein